MLTFLLLKKVGLLYSRVEAGVGSPEQEPHQNFYPEPEPLKNDVAPQH
jgi:hypothetical protein